MPAMDALALYLLQNGLTQKKFAETLNVDQATISKLVRGRLMPSLELAVAIQRETGGAVPAASWVRTETAA